MDEQGSLRPSEKSCAMASERMSIVLQRGFKQFLESGEFTDISVCVEDETFKLHKSVLSATVPYFQSLFSSSFKDASEDKIVINEISPGGFQEVVNLVYTSKMSLSEDNLQDVLKAADLLQVDEALTLCDQYLESYYRRINDAESCVYDLRDIYSLAVLYNRSDLVDTILCDLQKTAGECPGIYNLPLAAILDLLKDNSSMFFSEEDALYIAKKWLLMKDTPDGDRLQYAKDVLSKVRFPLLSQEVFVKEVLQDENLQKIEGFHDFIDEVKKERTLEPGQNFLTVDLQNRQRDCNFYDQVVVDVRDCCNFKQSLYSFPDKENLEQLASNVELYTSFIISSTHTVSYDITPAPPVAKKLLLDLHAASISQYLFCVTSYLDVSESGQSAVVESFAFDFLTNIWYKLPPPRLHRVHFTVVTYKRHLYMIGGRLGDGSFTGSVEMYVPKEDIWKTAGRLSVATAHAQGIQANGDLYVIGGLTDNGPSSHLFRLRKGARDWDVMSTSSYPFLAHRVLFLEPFIIVINADPRCVPETRDNSLITFYNTDTQQWIRPFLRKRNKTIALKKDLFAEPVLEMVVVNLDNLKIFLYTESKQCVAVRESSPTYRDAGDILARFHLTKQSEKEQMQKVHMVSATVMMLDGPETERILKQN